MLFLDSHFIWIHFKAILLQIHCKSPFHFWWKIKKRFNYGEKLRNGAFNYIPLEAIKVQGYFRRKQTPLNIHFSNCSEHSVLNCSLVLIITRCWHVRKIATDCKQSLPTSQEQFEIKYYYSNSFEPKVTYTHIPQPQVRNSFPSVVPKGNVWFFQLWKQQKLYVTQLNFYTNEHPSEWLGLKEYCVSV